MLKRINTMMSFYIATTKKSAWKVLFFVVAIQNDIIVLIRYLETANNYKNAVVNNFNNIWQVFGSLDDYIISKF